MQFHATKADIKMSAGWEGMRSPEKSRLNHIGKFTAHLWRNGKLYQKCVGFNGITTEGKNHLLDVVFGNATPVTQVNPWYIGLVDNSGFSAFLDADTLPSHTGWSELVPSTDYTGNRQTWVDANASAGSKTSSSSATFPILTTKTVKGILLAAVATGTAGVLMATGAFDATIDVINGDSLKVDYTIEY